MKCVVVGDDGVGKTRLVMSYSPTKFPNEFLPTLMDNQRVTATIGDDPRTVDIFDTIGSEDYRMRPMSYSQTDVFVVCFSVVSPVSFENVKTKWVPEVRHWCPGVPCVIVGTQIDLRDDPTAIERLSSQNQRPILPEAGERLAKELGAVKYVECSAETQKGLRTLLLQAIMAVLDPPS